MADDNQRTEEAQLRESADAAARVRSVRSRLAAQGPSLGRDPADFELISLPPSDADLLRDAVAAERAGTVIEIGLAYGSSALAIAESLVSIASTTRHVVIDPYQSSRFAGTGWQQLQAAGVEGVCELIEESSQQALPRLAASGFSADVAFVDGSHIFHNVFIDLYFLSQIVKPNGLVILDDCEWPSVAIAVSYYERYLGWSPAGLAGPTRLRAFRLPAASPPVDFKAFAAPTAKGW
ncbi:MAG: class I SAM-dependent methyltransferase [Mycobacteriales bacterium]